MAECGTTSRPRKERKRIKARLAVEAKAVAFLNITAPKTAKAAASKAKRAKGNSGGDPDHCQCLKLEPKEAKEATEAKNGKSVGKADVWKAKGATHGIIPLPDGQFVTTHRGGKGGN